MGKRHNRKRTRSRPRHRDGGNAALVKIQHTRSDSMDTVSSISTTISSSTFQQYPISISTAGSNADHWHHTYTAWQDRLRINHERQQEVELQRLRIFGGMPGDETSLLEPMLKVVTDLFDGFTDYEDP